MVDALSLEGQIDVFGTMVTRLAHPRSGCSIVHATNPSNEQGVGISVHTVPKNDEGPAHVLEHCLLFAPARSDGASMVDIARECGLTINAVTTHSHTTFFAVGPRTTEFPEFVRCYARTLFYAPVSEALFRREGIDRSTGEHCSGVVYNEMRELYGTAEKFIKAAVQTELFTGGSLAFDPGGSPSSLLDLTYESVLAYRVEFYRPERALLFLSGDAPDLDLVPELVSSLPDRSADCCQKPAELRIGATPRAPRVLAREYPSIDKETTNYAVLSFRLGSDSDEGLSWDWELLQRLLFRDRLSRIMRPIRSRFSNASPFDIRLQRSGPCLSFHFGISTSSAPEVEEFQALALASIHDAFAEVREQDVTASVQHSLVDAREDIRRPLSVLSWINGPWVHGADPLVYANARARADAALARYAARPSLLLERLRDGVLENPSVVLSAWRPGRATPRAVAAPSRATVPSGERPVPQREASSNERTRRPFSSRAAGIASQLPPVPYEHACSFGKVGDIEVHRNSPHLEGVTYVAVDVELFPCEGADERDLALVAMILDRFALGQRPLDEVLQTRKECLSAYVAAPYASYRVATDEPPVVGLRFGVKCPEPNFDWGLGTLAELLFLPLTDDRGLSRALPLRIVEQQRGFIRNGFFSLAQFAAVGRVSNVAQRKYHWSGQGMIRIASAAAERGDLLERIERVRGWLRSGRWRISYTGSDARFASLLRELGQWNLGLEATGPVSRSHGVEGELEERCFETFSGGSDGVHFGAAKPIRPRPDARFDRLEVAVKALSDELVAPALRTAACAHGGGLMLDPGHRALSLSCRTASALTPVLDILRNLPALAGALSQDALNHAIRSSAAPFLAQPTPGDLTMISLDRVLSRDSPEVRRARYREVVDTTLDQAIDLLSERLVDEADFPALAAVCPDSEIPVAFAARGTRTFRETPVHELLQLNC